MNFFSNCFSSKYLHISVPIVELQVSSKLRISLILGIFYRSSIMILRALQFIYLAVGLLLLCSLAITDSDLRLEYIEMMALLKVS